MPLDILARLTPDRFEDSMERSFAYFLGNAIPSITTTADATHSVTTPTLVLNGNPIEYTDKKRETNILLDVRTQQVGTEAYFLGASIIDAYRPDPLLTNVTNRSMPWMYNITYNINVYTGSGMDRSKMDGAMRNLWEQMRRGAIQCPVYEWQYDLSVTPIYNTGAFINVMKNKDAHVIHSEDVDQADYLSHWTIHAKCPYVIDTDYVMVDKFDVTETIGNLS